METEEINYTLEKWENLGLLKGLTDEEKLKTVDALIIAYKKFLEITDLSELSNIIDVDAIFISKYAEQKIQEIKSNIEQRELTPNRWEKLGLLEGLVGYDDSKNTDLFECCPNARINIE